MTKDEALKGAIGAEYQKSPWDEKGISMPLPEAPVQEPVAWTLLLVGEHHGIIGKAGEKFLGHPEHYERIDVYTTPPAAQRKWVGLTDEEIDDLSREMVKGKKSVNWLSYSIEAKLKEKNNG